MNITEYLLEKLTQEQEEETEIDLEDGDIFKIPFLGDTVEIGPNNKIRLNDEEWRDMPKDERTIHLLRMMKVVDRKSREYNYAIVWASGRITIDSCHDDDTMIDSYSRRDRVLRIVKQTAEDVFDTTVWERE